MSNSFDFEQFKANAIEQLKAGVPLSGKDGVLVPLLENLLNSALEGEMDSHLEGGECELSNRRHGHMSKHVQTSMGEVTINTPRDRDGTFNPQVVRKREKILADSLADRIIRTRACLHLISHWKNLYILHLRESGRSGPSRCRTGGRRPSNWLSCSRTGSGS